MDLLAAEVGVALIVRFEVEVDEIEEVVLVLDEVDIVGNKRTVVFPPIDAIPVETTPVELGATEHQKRKKKSEKERQKKSKSILVNSISISTLLKDGKVKR